MSADLPSAILERLTAAPLKAFDSPPPTTTTYPYVVVYFDAGVRRSDREVDVRIQREHGWQTTVVGGSASQVRAALDRGTAALEDWRPTVTGVTFSKVEHEGTQPTRPDPEMPDRTLYIATDQWRAVSDPV
ncbi:MAG: hypothetical protein HOQ27_10640 [Dermatophilaceae bacterium]|nr:hypothetical protein [Dermatophilaceae bacterium]